MKTLVVEDDFTGRMLLLKLTQLYGETHVAVNGREAVDAVRRAYDAGDPYDLICLDIMMPEMDGQQALRAIRTLEEERGVQPGQGCKIMMTTALSDKTNVLDAFREQCDAYLVKPIDARALRSKLEFVGLLP